MWKPQLRKQALPFDMCYSMRLFFCDCGDAVDNPLICGGNRLESNGFRIFVDPILLSKALREL